MNAPAIPERGPAVVMVVSDDCPACRAVPELLRELDLGLPTVLVSPDVARERFGLEVRVVPLAVVLRDGEVTETGTLGRFGDDLPAIRAALRRAAGVADDDPDRRITEAAGLLRDLGDLLDAAVDLSAAELAALRRLLRSATRRLERRRR